MANQYPFSPKSNAKLEIGQFWAIKLSNGQYGCGIILDIPSKGDRTTKSCFVGLLDWAGIEKPTQFDLENKQIKLLEQGDAHIKTITMKNELIIGKIDLKKTNIVLQFEVNSAYYGPSSWLINGYTFIRKSIREDHEIFKTNTTWGYDVINILAEKYLVDKNISSPPQ